MRIGRVALWLAGAGSYLAFCWWYTNWDGALSATEMAAFESAMREQGRDGRELAKLRRFMEEDDGGQFLMVNLLDMADAPKPLPGAAPAESSADAMDRYMAHLFPKLLARASHPAFDGVAIAPALDIVGIEGAEQWTDATLMRYRSRRDLLEIALDPIFGEKHDYKLAALDKTIAFPVKPTFFPADARILLALALLSVLLLADRAFRRKPDAELISY